MAIGAMASVGLQRRAIDGRRKRLPEERALWPDRERPARRFVETTAGW